MGASSSTPSEASAQQREVESLAASTGALPLLQKSFAKLADPQTNTVSIQSLEKCFHLRYKDPIFEASTMPDHFPQLLYHVGSSIVDLFFVPEKGGLSWVEFVRGYVKCCGRMSTSNSLNTLFRIFALAATKAGIPSKLEFESDDVDCKINGTLHAVDVLMLLWICWILVWDSRTSEVFKEKANLFVPDVNHLALSAAVSCIDGGSGLDVWDCNVSSLDDVFPVGKFLSWSLTTVPNLTDCLTQFVNARLQNEVTAEDESGASGSVSEDASSQASDTLLLTHGRAWTISISAKSTITEEALKPFFAGGGGVATDGNLLYRSSLHGRGLNRFWSTVEGYHGPVLILISANFEVPEDSAKTRKFIIGALTQQGFENRDTFYGTSGSLYAISPVFHAYSPSGREKNFVYSHLHPSGRVYEPKPKPVGIAFGGSIGNERIFIDEDFAKVTIRHHAVDKTYKSGSLIPNQGFLQVEAPILEVEVRGLGGKSAREVQTSYKKREQLFTEQRRKVDLKTFASWDDSPEKMMMDMMGDPNAVRREER